MTFLLFRKFEPFFKQNLAPTANFVVSGFSVSFGSQLFGERCSQRLPPRNCFNFGKRVEKRAAPPVQIAYLLLRISSLTAVFVPAIRFSFSEHSVSLPRKQNQKLLGARTENHPNSNRRKRNLARCRSLDFVRCYAVSAIEKAAVAFFAVAVNLHRRRRTRVCNRRLCFLERFGHRRSWLTSPSLRSLQLYSRRLSGIMVGVVSFGALGRG
jgi:hypothetical protein